MAADDSPHVSYMLDQDLRFRYCNPAWDWFATENGAPGLTGESTVGTDLLPVLGDALRPFYLRAFEQARLSEKVWECVYECSSPDLFRKFRMRIHPLAPSGWFMVTNPLMVESPHASTITAGIERYVQVDGSIIMCSHCRCSRRASPPEHWDFVPAYLEPHLTNISHGLCPVCMEYFYPKPEDYAGG